mgnify:CR=1 FL=1
MPKIVDHEERRRLIADAFATVVRRDGVAGASVRAVAAEAGISPGAMRHYFDTQTGLLRFVAQDLTERLTKHGYTAVPHLAARMVRDKAEAGMAYDQMLAPGNAEGAAAITAGVDALVAQTRSIERAVAALGLDKIAFEGSDSLDNPDAVFQ